MIKKGPRFKLTPNVVKEIQTLEDFNIPKYLVHRYRYEIYPQLKIFDDFPPYLQIEPTSICNYRCVFCYQTDNEFNKRSKGFMGHMKLETFKILERYNYVCFDLLNYKKNKFDSKKAQKVFGYSILYLFLIFLLIIIDSII